MANVRIVSWNIEVYGPKKYGQTPNNVHIARLVARVIVESGAQIAVLQEVLTAVAPQVGFTIMDMIANYLPHQTWSYFWTVARPGGNKESYVIIWRSDAGANIAEVANAAGLAANQFPNNFSATHGRRAAYKVFRTTDTGAYFAVTDYHAPANNNAVLGVESCALMAEIYSVTVGGVANAIQARLMAGDYNLDAYRDAAYFAPLTNPVPLAPPPNLAIGQGAGTAATLAGNNINDSTHLSTIGDQINAHGAFIAGWPVGTAAYRQNDMTIDNVYHRPTGAPNASGVIDVINLIRNAPGGTQVRGLANQFALTYPDGVTPAFPNAQNFPPNLAIALNTTGWAFLLYRYAISDHLPIFVDTTI